MAKYCFFTICQNAIVHESGHLEMRFEGLSRYKASFPDFLTSRGSQFFFPVGIFIANTSVDIGLVNYF
jgi:hypothetical protein